MYDKDKILIEFIKHIENNIVGRWNNIANFIRNQSIPILHKFSNINLSFNPNDRYFLTGLRLLKVLKNPNLIFKADKDNVMMVMDRDN